ncbi:chloride channel protein [Leifsonia xyli subsp. cynodontis DSM 46306]|uniref:Chloride channel protein n=1 Tax=Leifsonia xyli subsp. cynodontis DSM 46306 TaxID=1389489 RepID=U3PBZ8_LEIXC|nr:chloride channel protein [Leifsonia xyli]AGW42282.1 chloride channel protein [Leifsonia xyli subsp. cynodontis DSM 46306]
MPLASPVSGRGTPAWLIRLVVVTVLVGVGAGVGGGAVALALHALQHLAFGYSEGTFLDGLQESPPADRVVALAVAGVIGAVGWWLLRGWGRRRADHAVVAVQAAVDGQRMPVLVTLANAALQVVIVGLGASIGREVAPREIGALWASWLSERAGVTARERRILVACGAGAGLAAVYSVPFGGAVFALEILLAEISFATVLPAFAVSGVAALVASSVVPANPLYTVQQVPLSPQLVVWALLAGPLLGVAAVGFVRLASFAQARRPRSWGILIAMPLTFAAVGVVSLGMPAILGNGHALGQLALSATVPVLLLLAITLVKTVATVGTIGAGAAGGTLTPSLAIGAGLGLGLGSVWDALWPGVPLAGFALIGAAAFLAATMRAPVTALLLVMEFTHQGPQLLTPVMLCVAGAVAVGYVWERRRVTGVA